MRYLVPLATLLLASGCGGGPRGPTLHPASGSVIVSGKPAAGVLVRLHPRAVGPDIPIPGAVTGSDGRFTLLTSGRPGVPEGIYDVTLTWPPPMGLGPPGRSGPDRFKGRYAGPDRPFSQVVIRPGPNEMGPFDVPEKVRSTTPTPTPRDARP